MNKNKKIKMFESFFIIIYFFSAFLIGQAGGIIGYIYKRNDFYILYLCFGLALGIISIFLFRKVAKLRNERKN
ncbi:MAG TPA: hypothetical protein PLC53_01400 [Bacilli bacterium]|nr:hypothetical protein [Bacilli bacterium]